MKRRTTRMGWLVVAAALMAGISACNTADKLQPEETESPAVEAPKTYTLTVTATKGDDDASRALSLNGKTLNATWTAGEVVQVYSVTGEGLMEMESPDPIGTLSAQSSGSTTMLKGEFISTYTPTVGAKLRLRFNDRPDYTNQEGTLEYIATHCDYALAEITVASVDAAGVVTSTGTASFQNQQAIVKFSLKRQDGTTPVEAKSLTVTVGSTKYNVKLATPASDIFVAIKKAANRKVRLTATDGTNYFEYEKTGISFGIGQYYAIGVKMTMTSIDLSTLTSNFTAQDGDVLAGTLNGNYKISIADGATVTLSNVTINGVNQSSCKWAGITCLGHATIVLAEGTTNTVKGFQASYPGILPAIGKTLTIEGEGSLTVSSNGGAGIGGGTGQNCGNIHIKSGTINATGGPGGAGIGSAIGIKERGDSQCDTITISGGNVTATGGNEGAGIGSGYGNDANSSCGNILIEGGIVTATCGNGGTSIGKGSAESGYTSDCPSITFTTGITSLTLKSPWANLSAVADLYLNAGTVMANTVDITGSLRGFNAFLRFFNDRNPDFYDAFHNSSFNESTYVWTIAP